MRNHEASCPPAQHTWLRPRLQTADLTRMSERHLAKLKNGLVQLCYTIFSAAQGFKVVVILGVNQVVHSL